MIMQNRHRPSKVKITVKITRHVADQLALACKDPSKNKSQLTEKALAELLNPERDAQRDGGLARGLQQVNRQVNQIERHQQVLLESFGLFVRHFLTVTPMLPRSEMDVALAKGNQRFEAFVVQLGRRLAGSASLVGEVMEKVSSNEPDLLIREFDAVGLEGKPKSKPSAPGAPVPARGGEDPAPVELSSASSRSALAPGASPRKSGGGHG
jgi:hypothetical protein